MKRLSRPSVWFRALDHLRRSPAEAAARVVPREGATPQTFLASLGGAELTDREANLRLPGRSPSNLGGTLRGLSAVMLDHGLTAKPTGPPALGDGFVGSSLR